jgi:urease accessory protein
VRIVTKRRDGQAVLDRLHMSGSLKALFPRGPAPQAILINVAGGLTGGDRMEIAATAGQGSRLALTTQSAERVYRAAGGSARVRTHLRVASGAALDWLPQETILFEHGRLRRELTLDLAADATFIGVEMLVFGRRARGEAFRWGCLHDAWDVRIDGRLVWADRLRVVPDATLDPFASPFALAGAAALATLVVRPPRLDLAAARAAIDGIDATLTVVGGLLLARLLHVDAHALRRRVVLLVTALRRALFACDEPMPRVWAI